MTTISLARGGLPRLLAGLSYYHPSHLADHERTYGPLPVVGRRFIDVVDASGLTGRGGAGFPAGRKMRGVASGRGAKVVVANGVRVARASSKDRLLLTRLPHLVLDGVEAAAMAVGAADAYVCAHQHDTELLARLEAAVEERDDRVRVTVTGVPGRYVASEQSALVQYLTGGPAKPRYTPPRPHRAWRPRAADPGEQCRDACACGTDSPVRGPLVPGCQLPAAPGSMLVTVSGAVCRPGIYEIELGTPIGQVLGRAGGPSGAYPGAARRRLLRHLASGRRWRGRCR